MFLGRIKGHVVATAKDASIKGHKLVIVEPLKVAYDDPATAANGGSGAPGGGGGRFEVTGRAIVAIDQIGAGEGQLVLIVQGSSARMAQGMGKVPVDAVVVGIVDQAVVMGKSVGAS